MLKLSKRTRPPRKPPPSFADEYSIKEVLDELRETGIPYHDDHVPATGGYVAVIARRLGKATRYLIRSSAGPDVASIELPDEAELAARLMEDAERSELEVERVNAERDQRSAQVATIEDVPDHDLDPKLRKINLAGKATFIAGDTGVIAQPQYMAGTPLLLALLTGLAVSLTVVFSGTFIGEWVGAHLRRLRRGLQPPEATQATVDLYDDGKPHPEIGHLLIGGGGLMVLVASAVLVMLVGDGASFGHALGAAMFAALTLVGSSALQGWTSNLAANRVAESREQLAVIEAKHATVEAIPGQAAGQQAKVKELRRVTECAASAGEYLSLALADFRHLYPGIFTYDPLRHSNGSSVDDPASTAGEEGEDPTDPQVLFAAQNPSANPNGGPS